MSQPFDPSAFTQQTALDPADNLPTLLENIRSHFELMASSIQSSNTELYPLEQAREHLIETQSLLRQLHDDIKKRNLLSFPADPNENCSGIASKQKQITDGVKMTLLQNQTNSATLSKAFSIQSAPSVKR